MAVEVCIDSVASAIAAAEVRRVPRRRLGHVRAPTCPADVGDRRAQARCERVELCASLVEGGVTPSAGMRARTSAVRPASSLTRRGPWRRSQG